MMFFEQGAIHSMRMKHCNCIQSRWFVSHLGISPGAATVISMKSGRSQICNCNPELLAVNTVRTEMIAFQIPDR